jgi:sulfite exporter TauE/SafE
MNMMQLITGGMALGLFGSFHCVGMCGPIALSLPIRSENPLAKFGGTLLYNSGRVVTYVLLGGVFGLAGMSLAFFGFQQWLSIVLGVAILLYLFFSKMHLSERFPLPGMEPLFLKIRNILGRLYAKENFAALFSIGLLNGLLPCGMVYMALAGALAMGSPTDSAVFMASFGAGTLPLMWAFAFFGNFLASGIRMKLRRASPYIMGIVAGLLIIRGLGLGFPVISPKVDQGHREMIQCLPH